MLDINYIRDHADQLKQACQDKQLDAQVVDQLLKVDEQRRELITQVQELRSQANNNADEVKKQVSEGGKPAAELEIGRAHV